MTEVPDLPETASKTTQNRPAKPAFQGTEISTYVHSWRLSRKNKDWTLKKRQGNLFNRTFCQRATEMGSQIPDIRQYP
jgi:hypothetical protein